MHATGMEFLLPLRKQAGGLKTTWDGFGNRTTWCLSQQLQPYELPSFAALIRIGSG